MRPAKSAMSNWRERVRGVGFASARIAIVLIASHGNATAGSAVQRPAQFDFGRSPTQAEITAWDIDVRPDGQGLPEGHGSVAEGRTLYDAQCASCHGTFGENNQYLQIAGGVGTLASDQPVRTTGSKLKSATTLFDYIRRAMPFNAPKTLSDNDVYALTAYVLYLNELLAADASLDPAALVALQMPNRNGFTTVHGLMSVKGKPDTHNVACMSQCGTVAQVASAFPDYALDSHGDLGAQSRPLGPVVAVQHTKSSIDAAPSSTSQLDLLKKAACTTCHGVNERIVGPSFREVSQRYAGRSEASEQLTTRVRRGGAGSWGAVPMPPQLQVSDAELRAIIGWILGGAK
jgi:S-disulfanyl-L-cysteine oxidoreductase SoxD